MGDDKYYTIQVKGTAYRFQPIPDDDLERVGMIFNLSVSNQKVLKALTRTLAASAGEEQWDQITDRYVAKEITLQEMTSGIFSRLVERQKKDADPADDAE